MSKSFQSISEFLSACAGGVVVKELFYYGFIASKAGSVQRAAIYLIVYIYLYTPLNKNKYYK